MSNDIVIDLINPTDTETLSHIYNEVYRPNRTPDNITRRLRGRHQPLAMIARIKNDAVGFFVGFELKPTVYFCWLVGVTRDMHRLGIGSQLMRAAQEWATENKYCSIRFECNNTHRPMLHFGISEGYEIVGLRWDPDTGQNLVIFEKLLGTIREDES